MELCKYSKTGNVRTFHIEAIQIPIVYNKYGDYDPVCDSGINVGYNEMEQTVGVGESKRYLWHADQEYGACIVRSFGHKCRAIYRKIRECF